MSRPVGAEAHAVIRESVREDMGPELCRLASLATEDLYSGPLALGDLNGDPYPGFTAAIAALAAFEWPELWYDADSDGLSTVEPPDDYDYDGDWRHVSVREVKRAVLGALAEYV